MLKEITITNFAIIESLTTTFETGMSVLTGETGAGKSIIIDALALLSGGRGSSDLVRYGQDKAVLQGLFDLSRSPRTKALLREHGIPFEHDELLIQRDIYQTGKTTVRLNGLLTTVAVLKELGKNMIDIHGQHEHQYLMDDAYHLSLLDAFADERLQTLKHEYITMYQEYMTSRKLVKQLMVSDQQDAQRIVLLKRHVEEIGAVNPQPDEDVLLEQELGELERFKQEASAFESVDGMLSHEDVGVVVHLSRVLSTLEQLAKKDERYEGIVSSVENSLQQVQGVSSRLVKMMDANGFDPIRYEDIQKRLVALDKLKDNYGQTIADVILYYEHSKSELDQLLNKDKYLSQAQKTFLENREQVLTLGQQLSQERRNVARQLKQAVQEQLKDLYMDKVQFEVDFMESVEKVKITETGLDNVAFLMSTNIGEPLKPLDKVASGGELSRIMLALKTIFIKNQGVSTVVFDEIDTGVSGRVSQAIANKMVVIARSAQVLCISHLPQVAAVAHTHYFVKKSVVANRTITQMDILDTKERQEEIAKMMTGEVVTESALVHAKALLEQNNH